MFGTRKDQEGSGRNDVKWWISLRAGREGMWSPGGRRGALPGHGASGRAGQGPGWQPPGAVHQDIPPGAGDTQEGAAVLRHIPCLSLSCLLAKYAGQS